MTLNNVSHVAQDTTDNLKRVCSRCRKGDPVMGDDGVLRPYNGHLVLLLVSSITGEHQRFICARCWLGEDALDGRRLDGVDAPPVPVPVPPRPVVSPTQSPAKKPKKPSTKSRRPR